MLPRWRDQASVLLAPHAVTLRFVARGLRPAARVTVFPRGPGEAPWQATLGDAMRGLPAGAICRIIVSSCFARYALVPFSPALVDRKAIEGLAAQVFRHRHGEQAQAWTCRVAPASVGDSRLACALDAALVETVESVARTSGVILAALEPALTAAFNAARGRMPLSCWFATVETGRLVLGLLVGGKWTHLAAERCAGHWEAALARMLSREALMVAAESLNDGLPCWVARFGATADADPERPEVRTFATAGADGDPRDATIPERAAA